MPVVDVLVVSLTHTSCLSRSTADCLPAGKEGHTEHHNWHPPS